MILNSIKKVNLFMVDLKYQMIMRALSDITSAAAFVGTVLYAGLY